ncbi:MULTISPECIES: hypothetical protein [Cyanophyceae]|uniref:hypothetical protein n=1 Tax=Cyanophyceae TaxID=3028117 RepID=UPI001686B407|nr:hypothetical protein [Trichocoleus sp. FACHB-69]MBD1935614.1 hypothetical protein [Trichocoleus sp. FACHB-69]
MKFTRRSTAGYWLPTQVRRHFIVTELKSAIQRRIDQCRANGIGFIEGQILPHGINLQTACTLAEYWSRYMDAEALTLIKKLPPHQHKTINSIYSRCMGMKRR